MRSVVRTCDQLSIFLFFLCFFLDPFKDNTPELSYILRTFVCIYIRFFICSQAIACYYQGIIYIYIQITVYIYKDKLAIAREGKHCIDFGNLQRSRTHNTD